MKKNLLYILTLLSFGCSQTPPDMTLVTGGDFTYGSKVSGENITKETKANLKDFYIDIFEVTNEQYREFVKETKTREPSLWALNGYDKTKAQHPVVFVKLDDAKAFCQWKDKSLPTEAQWERAARGDSNFHYPWGNEFKVGLSNTVTSNIIGTTAVGVFPEGKSPYGVMDMTGNVSEWTTTEDKDNIEGSDEQFYITKGGSWGYSHSVSKTYNHFLFEKDSKANNLGFRCVK